MNRQDGQAPEGGRTGWTAALASTFCIMFGPPALLATNFGVLAAGLEGQTGWSHSSVAYASTLISIVTILTSPLQGILADRLGGRRLILISMPLFAVALIAFRFSTGSIGAFYATSVVAAIAGMGIWPLAYLRVMAGWFQRHIGIVTGIVMCGVGLSTTIYPRLLGSSFQNIGWASTYTMFGIALFFVVWPLAWFLVREAPAPPRAVEHVAPAAIPVLDRREWRIIITAILVFVVLGVVSSALLVHGVHILRGSGFDVTGALKIQSLVGLGVVVGRLGIGYLLDRFSVRIVGSCMFVIASIAFSLHLGEHARAVAVIASLLGGLVIGAEFDILSVLIRRRMRLAVYGRVFGIIYSAFHIGGAIGSASFAYILDRTGSFQSALVALVIVTLCCAPLFFFGLGRDNSINAEARS